MTEFIPQIASMLASVGGAGVVILAVKFLLDDHVTHKREVREEFKAFRTELKAQAQPIISKLDSIEKEQGKLYVEQINQRHHMEKLEIKLDTQIEKTSDEIKSLKVKISENVTIFKGK